VGRNGTEISDPRQPTETHDCTAVSGYVYLFNSIFLVLNLETGVGHMKDRQMTVCIPDGLSTGTAACHKR